MYPALASMAMRGAGGASGAGGWGGFAKGLGGQFAGGGGGMMGGMMGGGPKRPNHAGRPDPSVMYQRSGYQPQVAPLAPPTESGWEPVIARAIAMRQGSRGGFRNPDAWMGGY